MPLYIQEYVRTPIGRTGQSLPAGEEPAIASQVIAVSGASAQSAALNAKTTFVRIHTSEICSLKFGVNPTATTNDMRLPANATEFFGVQEEVVRAGTFKIAVITNT